MALITRLTRLFRADAHAVLDRMEEPDVVLAQAVREMEEDVGRTSRQLKARDIELQRLRQRASELAASIAHDRRASWTCASRPATRRSRARCCGGGSRASGWRSISSSAPRRSRARTTSAAPRSRSASASSTRCGRRRSCSRPSRAATIPMRRRAGAATTSPSPMRTSTWHCCASGSSGARRERARLLGPGGRRAGAERGRGDRVHALAPMVGAGLVLRALVVGVGAAYLALLLPSLEARVGRIVVVAAWLRADARAVRVRSAPRYVAARRVAAGLARALRLPPRRPCRRAAPTRR